MATEILMPKLGLTMTEGTIDEWKKNVGDPVSKGEIIFSVETDKLTNDVEADTDGVLLKIAVQAGETVPCKAVVGWIGAAGESIPDAAAPTEAIPAAPSVPAEVEANSVLVVGGGPGGYVAAIRAAQLGAKVTLIEKDKLGGTCLNRGCMPTKAMLHTSEIYETATHSADIGIVGADVQIDWTKVQGFRASVVEKLTSGVQALCKANKVKVITGEAKFTGPKTVAVGGESFTADKVIIAAGSYPILPGIPGVKEYAIDSTACLSLDHIPESMLVIGGGVIGLELGSVYRRYGAKVVVVELQEKLLPGMDAELTKLLETKLVGEGLEIYTSTAVTKVEKTADGLKVSTDNGKEFVVEQVLAAAGRGPATEGLGLDTAGIQLENGFIQTNEKQETNVPGVYAIGDCTGKLMLAHAAMAMGEVAADNALGGEKAFYPEQSPSCAYVGPEFAGVGYTEDALKERGIAYKVGKFPTSGNGRSLVAGHTDGMVKVLAGTEYGEILGVHILAPGATELIEEAALAIKLEATLEEFTETIHCHPTVAEAVRESALNADGMAIHIPNKKKK